MAGAHRTGHQPKATTMSTSKKSAAKTNIRTTNKGALRTGNNAQPVAPVKIIYGPGGSSLPCPVKPTHPEPRN